jgi:hypothetical protein
MLKPYIFHSDPGHAWLEVDRQELKDLNILQDITTFSYQKGDKVFLEEDCDYSTFVKAYMKKYGTKPEYTEQFKENTPIRSYDYFKQ